MAAPATYESWLGEHDLQPVAKLSGGAFAGLAAGGAVAGGLATHFGAKRQGRTAGRDANAGRAQSKKRKFANALLSGGAKSDALGRGASFRSGYNSTRR